MLWQSVQSATTAPDALRWRLCVPEYGLLFSGLPAAVPSLWHDRHPASALMLMVPVCQLGAATAPWQLTLAQVKAVLLKVDAPAFALYVVTKATSPGATRNAFFPGTAFARS
jgi:hypothetical protein